MTGGMGHNKKQSQGVWTSQTYCMQAAAARRWKAAEGRCPLPPKKVEKIRF